MRLNSMIVASVLTAGVVVSAAYYIRKKLAEVPPPRPVSSIGIDYADSLLKIHKPLMGAEKLNKVDPAEIDRRVAVVIDRMTNRATEHQAFADLEALGCPAVRSIVARMDDRRKLPDPWISLENKWPGAFEGTRNYGPQKVVDALAAILNQLTGQDFGSIYNGATDEERTQAVQGWRDFLIRTPTAKLCAGG